MAFSTVAARAARLSFFAAVVALAANLAACGTEGSTSSHLTAGEPTNAPPGNLVLYVAMAQGNRIDAYRLGTDGLLPASPFSSIFIENPRRIAVADGVLYTTLDDRVLSIKLGADGTLPNEPTASSLTREDYDPIDLEVRDGILYVAASGSGRVESYELNDDGSIPVSPTGSGVAENPSDFSAIELAGPYLYSGSRQTQFIELFVLQDDGHVPPTAELQDPRDRISLPDDIVVRNGILYVTSAGDNTVRAYKLMPGGFVPDEEDSETQAEEFYSDILLHGDTLYAAAFSAGRIDLYEIAPDGMLIEKGPFRKTRDDPASFPSQMLMFDDILYVAQAGLDRVDAYVLDGQGLPPSFPSSSTTPAPGKSFPLDLALYPLN